MGAKSHISKWGDSLAVRIPKPIAEQWGVREGSAIEMSTRGDRVVMRKRGYQLADMLSEMNRRQPPRRTRPRPGAGRRGVVAKPEVSGADYVPGRGDIVWLSSTPQAGQEQAGRRPALVVSPRSYNEKSSLALLCPITSRAKATL